MDPIDSSSMSTSPHPLRPDPGAARDAREPSVADLAPIVEDRRSAAFAARYDRMRAGNEEHLLAAIRADLLTDLTGRVVEIGAGTGANLPYYRAVSQLDLVEPYPAMRDQLSAKVASTAVNRPAGAAVQILDGRAEAVPLPDHCADAVVVTMVLCSVADVERSLAEVRRLLRPGGVFDFIEHGRRPGIGRYVQRALTPLMVRYAAGCHLDRDLLGAIQGAGFERVETMRLSPPRRVRMTPQWPFCAGRAYARS